MSTNTPTRTLRLLIAGAITIASSLAGTPAAHAGHTATPYTTISSAGPLSEIHLGNELSCQVAHAEDAFLEFYPEDEIPGDCGTFVELAGTLYAPDFNNHGWTATEDLGSTNAWTPISQSGVSGTGAPADPFLVTTVAGGGSALTVTEEDRYVEGSDAYRTDITVRNNTDATTDLILYRAGDCYLGGSDHGYGFTAAVADGTAIGCSTNADNSPLGRIEQWEPLSPGSTYIQDYYSSVWAHIGGGTMFENSCLCADFEDNGAGLSWSLSIPAGGEASVAHLTRFSGSIATTLVANPAIARVLPQNAVYLKMSARLTVSEDGAPLRDKRVHFSVGDTFLCSASTNATGDASCGSTTALIDVVRARGYTAEFEATYDYKASDDFGPLLEVDGKPLP